MSAQRAAGGFLRSSRVRKAGLAALATTALVGGTMVALAPSSTAASSTADARNLIVNSNFANPVVTASDGFDSYTAPSSAIPGWLLVAGNLDVNNATAWQQPPGDPAGTQSVDLNGTVAAQISQTFPTVAGETYSGSFELAANPGGFNPVNPKTGQLIVAGKIINFSFDSSSDSASSMGWVQENFTFTATSSSTTATFVSGVTGDFGPVVTDVIVDAPLPPTISTNSNVTVYQTTPAGTPVSFALPTATDPNGGTVSVACAPASGSVFPAGSNTVTCTATTSEGTTASSRFVVKVLPLTTSCEGLPFTDKGYLTAHPNYGANTPTTPCVSSTYAQIAIGPLVLTPAVPLLHIPATGVNANVLRGLSEIAVSPSVAATSANSTVASVAVSALGLTLTAHAIYSQATALMTGALCTDEVTSGLSDIANLTINGKSIIVSTKPITIKLGLINVYVNQTVKVGNVVTQRALVVNIGGNPANDIVFGQAVAGVACS